MSEDIRALAQEIVQNKLSQVEPEGQGEQPPAEEQVSEIDQSTPEVETEEEYIEYVADGATHKATLDELKKLAAAGQNYTRKMQELPERAKAEAEKIVQERAKRLDGERSRLIESCDIVESFYGKPFVTTEQLDQLLSEGDTETYLRLSRQEEKRKEILNQAKAERQKALDEKAAQEKEQLHQQAIQHTEMLFQKMPELKDPASQAKLAAYLRSAGLSNQEIENFVDHRGLIIAEKARRYDELSSGKIEPVKKDPPKVIRKVGATVNKQAYTEKQLEASQKKLQETGRLRDAAALYLQMKGKQQ